MANVTISAAKIALLDVQLEAIATACNVLKRAGHNFIAEGSEEVLGSAVVALAEKAGSRTDACRVLLGFDQICGSWEDWVASPVEIEVRGRLAAEEAKHG